MYGTTEFSFDDPERARRAANVFAVFLAVLLLLRGFHVHTGFAVFMAVSMGAAWRLFLEFLIYENLDVETYAEKKAGVS